MNIALSKGSGSEKYQMYGRWLHAVDPSITIVDLVGLRPEDGVARLKECSGLILTGGEDVDPDRYQQPEKRAVCGTINPERDALELAVAQAAIDANIPVLGICRGLQVLNVLYGGTLIADIPRDDHHEHRQYTDPETSIKHDSEHDVFAEPGSLIKRICRTTEGTINSAHHQAIEKIANMFAPAATASDGIIEAIEWGDATLGGKPFLLAVQWHPERMDWNSPFSMPIAQHFIHECMAYQALLRQA